VKQIAILLTDGMSNLNRQYTIPNALAAKGDDIEIFAIGMYSRFLIYLLTTDLIHYAFMRNTHQFVCNTYNYFFANYIVIYFRRGCYSNVFLTNYYFKYIFYNAHGRY